MASEQQPQAGYTKDSELVRRLVAAVENCDPLASSETLCEAVAEVLNTQQAREWTAEDVTPEQMRRFWLHKQANGENGLLDDELAAAANVMRVPRPQPAVAVDVERLAVLIENELEVYGPRTRKSIADTLRRELSQPKAARPESEANQ